MVPNEVVVIAEEIALHFLDSSKDWKDFQTLADRIYNRLKLEAEAEKVALTAPDD